MYLVIIVFVPYMKYHTTRASWSSLNFEISNVAYSFGVPAKSGCLPYPWPYFLPIHPSRSLSIQSQISFYSVLYSGVELRRVNSKKQSKNSLSYAVVFMASLIRPPDSACVELSNKYLSRRTSTLAHVPMRMDSKHWRCSEKNEGSNTVLLFF